MVNPQSSPRPWLLQYYSLWMFMVLVWMICGYSHFWKPPYIHTLHYIITYFILLHYLTLHTYIYTYIYIYIHIHTYSHYRFGPWECHAQRKEGNLRQLNLFTHR